METTTVDAKVRSSESLAPRLRELIEHAAHLLPAQGPITAFVHHNTLHALEDQPFEEAVVRGARLFGCHPYLSEFEYRRHLARGRIQPADIEAVLIDDLGETGDELLGALGTRFHLRMAMLAHPLHLAPTAELRWVVAETEALRTFRREAPPALRERMVADTRHWIMRDLRNGRAAGGADSAIVRLVDLVFERFDKRRIEQWEDDTWETFTLHLLWRFCKHGVEQVQGGRDHAEPRSELRHRDLLFQVTGRDADLLVHDVLIRFCAAFIDQGFAPWSLPERQAGFFQAFLRLYGQPAGPLDLWLKGLSHELCELARQGTTPEESIQQSLVELGVEGDEQESFITQSLLALRGYAGMIWQLETRGDRAAMPVPQGSLMELLAVRLLLDRFALAQAAHETLGYCGRLRDLRAHLQAYGDTPPRPPSDRDAFLLFQLSQVIGWQPQFLSRLSHREWTLLLREIDAFSALERRRIYHLAFERRYRLQTLDAVAIHSRRVREHRAVAPAPATRPVFQIVCCIDEREESFRRHLEEIEPACETLGAAGFFAVAMYYRGAADAHFTPLCPVIIKPQHYVVEDAVYSFEQTDARRRRRRRVVATVTHRAHVGSRTFAGGWLAGVLGSLASIPLVMRILFPRTTARLRRLFSRFVRPPAVTQLRLERTAAEPGPDGDHVGYRVEEMADVVERLLRDMGLTRNFSRLIIICGHGSSSLNNPHEAAHDCGACGGGRGGPNARAFAQMANDPRVRQRLAAGGLAIPDDTVFVGVYHNTCDDSVAYYDLDRLPATHREDIKRATKSIDEARRRNAHERCRRFESAELGLTPEAALRHVEARAEDLSQVRPEYGHATNALCFVGRREWSRGLFLDRRAFLQSYDPAQDDAQGTLLTRVLQAVIPVCAGINLEYYFSFVDPTGYGCGTKLPHNITSLLGVMNGAASDLRPGLPWQMVEIHEPVRLLFVVETTPEAILRILDQQEGIRRLVEGRWVQLAVLDPETSVLQVYAHGRFQRHRPTTDDLPTATSSMNWYRGWRDHLGYATIEFPST